MGKSIVEVVWVKSEDEENSLNDLSRSGSLLGIAEPLNFSRRLAFRSSTDNIIEKLRAGFGLLAFHRS